MPRLRIIYDVDGWAYHNEALALQKYAPPDFEVSIAPHGYAAGATTDAALGTAPVDIVLSLREFAIAELAEALRRQHPTAKLVAGWSCGFPRQLGHFYAVRDLADAWIFNNRECWEGAGRLPRTHAIANGVDLDIFHPTRPLGGRRPKVLWVGSERYRRLKGYDDLILPLQQRLRARGIDCELLLVDSYGPHKRTPQQMAEWYNDGTVLVCASASEGTPNPALEAAACGCTVVSTRVGNMPELIGDDVNGYLVDRDLDALESAVDRAIAAYPRLAAAMQDDIRSWHWATRRGELFAVFRQVLDGRGPVHTTRPDLSTDVTVFVTTVGATTFERCLAHLRDQDCTFTLRVIENVAPMNAAFQRMLDECRTPHYVQIDEDMLLYPDAIRTLHTALVNAPPDVAAIVRNLYDVHLERCVQGVKIFRHEIVRRYPFSGDEAFEVEQLVRLEADGFRYLRPPASHQPSIGDTLGAHGTDWTAPAIYERYANLESRRRMYPERNGWFGEYGPIFLRRFLDDPNELNFFALMGVIAGRVAPPVATAKDYRRQGERHEFVRLREWLEAVRQSPMQRPEGAERARRAVPRSQPEPIGALLTD